MEKMGNKLTYEQALSELESIVSAVENKNIGVDELTKKVERAAYLIKYCKEKLQTTDKEVKKILDEIKEKEKE